VVSACSGCHLLFQLEHIDGSDAAIDDAGIDAPDAAFTCAQTNISPGDFDLDGKPNAEDECPDIKAASGDLDADGVGDMCDPHPNIGGDCLRVFTDFATPDLRCWTTEGWSYGCYVGDPLGWCSPGGSHRTPLRYDKLAPLVFARMTGTLYAINGAGSSVIMLNNYTLAANLVGDACGVTNLNGNFAVASGLWRDDMITNGARSPTIPSTAYQLATIKAVRGAQCIVTATTAATMATTTGSSAAYQDAVGGFAVHTVVTEFRIESLAGYNFGPGCD
jgi:hypothetical protein